MKKFGVTGSAILTGILLAAGCGQKQTSEGRAVVGSGALASPIEINVKEPDGESTVALQIALPKGWEVNPDYGTLVYEPVNRGDFLEAPSIEITTAVAGEVSPEAIPHNIARHIQGVKDRWKMISTGNADLDAKGANMEIVAETKGDGEWMLQLMLTYPEGVSEAMYPPRYWIYRYLHRAGEPFFVLVNGKIPVKEADQLLAPVANACKSAKRL